MYYNPRLILGMVLTLWFCGWASAQSVPPPIIQDFGQNGKILILSGDFGRELRIITKSATPIAQLEAELKQIVHDLKKMKAKLQPENPIQLLLRGSDGKPFTLIFRVKKETPPAETQPRSDVEKKLDRLLTEMEEMRRDIKKLKQGLNKPIEKRKRNSEAEEEKRNADEAVQKALDFVKRVQKQAADEKSPVVEVGTIRPVRKDMTRTIAQPGYLRPFETTPIYTMITGFAYEPKCDIGDVVRKGDLLVALYAPDVVQDLNIKKAKVRQAQTEVKQAEEEAKAAKAGMEAAAAGIDAKKALLKIAYAQMDRWNAEMRRATKFYESGTFDKATLDEVSKELRVSEAKKEEAIANLKSAEANYRKASARFHKTETDIEVAFANVAIAETVRDQCADRLSYAQITAPYDGVITDRRVHTGHFLQPPNNGSSSKAEPLFVMMRTDIMRCTVEIPELDALLVRRGDKAVIRMEAIPGVEFAGTVRRTTMALDERSRTMRAEVWLKNAPGARELRPNMTANVKILAKVGNAWMLPTNAILFDILANGDRRYCFVVEDGKAHKVFLEIGAICDEGVQILRKRRLGQQEWTEFTGNEVVVTTNNKALQDGQEVRVKAP